MLNRFSISFSFISFFLLLSLILHGCGFNQESGPTGIGRVTVSSLSLWREGSSWFGYSIRGRLRVRNSGEVEVSSVSAIVQVCETGFSPQTILDSAQFFSPEEDSLNLAKQPKPKRTLSGVTGGGRVNRWYCC